MGVVFQGEDPRLGRRVALKAMLPHLARSPSAQQRFLREARAAAALEHDHIVPIFHVGEDRGAPFIVMPLLKGESLDSRLRAKGALPVPEVLRIGREIAEGLAAAHAAGLIHRDIKPGNLWLEDGTGRVKILDFGLARAAAQEPGLTQQGAILGTPSYMAPEQSRGEKVDARCDLWSLGVVLYRLCAGRLPFHGADAATTLRAVAGHDPLPPATVNATVPAGLSDLVMQLLEKDPAKRVASAVEVVAALRSLEKGRGPAGGKTPVDPRPGAAPRRKGGKLLLLGLGGVLAAAGALAFVLFRPPPPGPVGTDGNGPGDELVPGGTGPAVLGAAKESLPKSFTNGLDMEFVLVPRGKSWLGGGGGKPGTREVDIKHDFYLGKFEVLQDEWQKVMGKYPRGSRKAVIAAKKQGKRFPVGNVSWDKAQVFLKRLNALEKEAGWTYRLPKEVEWEYACRGGPMADRAESRYDFYFKEPTNELLPSQANFGQGKEGRFRPVGSYEPNRLGLYDMHGNAWELCNDARKGAHRAIRGGACNSTAAYCRAAQPFGTEHYHTWPTLGLRVARVPVATKAK
jgi:formylglycine-generating enzyme required for sulfatase activity